MLFLESFELIKETFSQVSKELSHFRKEKIFKGKYEKAYSYLEEDEVECALCDGTGNDYKSGFPRFYKCVRCNGTGKTDWVTNVMGSYEENNPYEYRSYASSSSSVLIK